MTLFYSWNVSRYLTWREPWFTWKINRYEGIRYISLRWFLYFPWNMNSLQPQTSLTFLPSWSWSWVAGYCILHPRLKCQHVRIYSESLSTRTTNSPADDTYKIPLVISRTDQRSSTVSSACINSSTKETCTAHASRNAISAVWLATSFSWYKRNFDLLQNLKEMSLFFTSVK